MFYIFQISQLLLLKEGFLYLNSYLSVVFLLLREMRETQIHFALVGQSDSQFIGVITLEDVLEAIVGEIVDESDKVYREN